ncbi:MAG: bifunctional demethylmenaquinone methyltransferase/2-methoxy-6-polyprenyl-1,4-benzoquinol methylase UbiE [Verrucomicrobia bacterium]|nr:MAG: bifunctional demethylmenaquinone methyltransferase/2-methoxy-6-polyprenyl-1,4-benzoquinol methylase UbiE [Verrucomicrobiota bacterium]
MACDRLGSIVQTGRARKATHLGSALDSIQSNQLSESRDPDNVRAMFGAIARRYDLANHILSCGRDFLWRRRAAAIVAQWKPGKVVDLATGTGDLALAIQRVLPKSEVIGVDFAEEMLALARTKGVRQTIAADVLALPFPDRTLDCITIAFGLRNVSDWAAALREMARVLTRNGHLLVLEFSLPQMSILRSLYRLYLHRLLPIFGSFLTRKKTAYDYLGDSIEQFPGGEELLRLIEGNGFRDAVAESLTGGIVTIYTAKKNG